MHWHWVRSYLADRTQTVRTGDSSSTPAPLSCGVPQSSVLGPVLFIIYMMSLGEIARRHEMKVHTYADYTQVYVPFDVKEDPSTIWSIVEACVADLKRWMTSQFLQLNDTKTEVVCFASRRAHVKPSTLQVRVGSSLVRPSPKAKNLGVVFASP